VQATLRFLGRRDVLFVNCLMYEPAREAETGGQGFETAERICGAGPAPVELHLEACARKFSTSKGSGELARHASPQLRSPDLSDPPESFWRLRSRLHVGGAFSSSCGSRIPSVGGFLFAGVLWPFHLQDLALFHRLKLAGRRSSAHGLRQQRGGSRRTYHWLRHSNP
jgi:hypothetical protein